MRSRTRPSAPGWRAAPASKAGPWSGPSARKLRTGAGGVKASPAARSTQSLLRSVRKQISRGLAIGSPRSSRRSTGGTEAAGACAQAVPEVETQTTQSVRPRVTDRILPSLRKPSVYARGGRDVKKDGPPGAPAPGRPCKRAPCLRFSCQRTRYNQRLLLSGRMRRRRRRLGNIGRRLLLARPARLDTEAEERLVVEAEAAPEHRRELGVKHLPPLLEILPLPHGLLEGAAQVLLLGVHPLGVGD